jgi:alpha-1,3-rhamnosyl/mannosyltransferase
MPEVAGDAALLIDPLDEAAIADALRRLVESPALRADLRGRGLLRARRHTWRATAERTLEIYRQCG